LSLNLKFLITILTQILIQLKVQIELSTGLLALNEQGQRNQFSLKLLNLTKNGLEIIANWSTGNGLFIEMNNQKRINDLIPSKRPDYHLMVAVVLVKMQNIKNKIKNHYHEF